MIIEHNGVMIHETESMDLQEIIRKVNEAIEEIQSQDQVVMEIMIDGFDVTGKLEEHIKAIFPKVKCIGIRSISLEAMYTETYNHTVDYLQRVHKATDSIADLFYGEPDSNAWDYLAQLVEGLQYSISALQAIKTHGFAINSDVSMVEAIELFISRLGSISKEIEQAIEAGDAIMLADLIKYELGDQVTEIIDRLKVKL